MTGARTAVEVTVDLPPDQVWDLVSDVSRMGVWSPECTYAGWLDADASVPRAGARFEGRNRYPNGDVSSVVCVVTEAVRPVSFAWMVLDSQGDAGQPASLWRYELSPDSDTGRTVVRHSFVHGPGASGARDAAHRETASLAERLEQVRCNMTASLAAMTQYGQTTRCEEGL